MQYWKLKTGLAIRAFALRLLPSDLTEFLERSDNNALAAWAEWYQTESKDASMKTMLGVMLAARNKYIDDRLA